MAPGPEAKGGPSRAETRCRRATRHCKVWDSTHLLHFSGLAAVCSEDAQGSLLYPPRNTT